MKESRHTYERVMFTLMNESRHTYARDMSHKEMSHVTHMIESCHTDE